MRNRRTVAEAAAAYLRRTGEPGVMHGDAMLLHEIAEAAGMKQQGPVTQQRVLARLEGSPLFRKSVVRCPDGRRRRCFDLTGETVDGGK